jgi:SAM-dependent methyltransferase
MVCADPRYEQSVSLDQSLNPMPWDHRTFARIPSLTWQCSPRVGQVINSFAPDGVVVDVGAGGRRLSPNAITLDFLEGSGTDVVCDVTTLPIRDASVDLVVSTGVLEHVAREKEFISEIRRVLKLGGTAYIEIPFLQQYHEDPIDCRRLTLPGLKMFLEQNGFRTVDAGFHIGPSVTIATLTAHYLSLLFEGRTLLHKVLSTGVFVAASILLYPLKYVDAYLRNKPGAHRLAFGVYCRAEKI